METSGEGTIYKCKQKGVMLPHIILVKDKSYQFYDILDWHTFLCGRSAVVHWKFRLNSVEAH